MYKKIVLSSLMAGALLAVNGCGGGGSSTGTAVAPATLSGVAVDDLILNGIVKAKDTAGNLLSEGRTSMTDGSYTLTVAHTGVVLVNATCDENSTMYNPETNTSMLCGPDVNLNSITSITEAGQPVTVNISPLTEIVYERALTLAGDDVSSMTEDDFDTARAEVGVMLSVDPIADDPLADEYADIIDVIHTMAETSEDPDLDTVMEVTAALAAALSDGSADQEPVIMDFVTEMDEANLTNNLVEDNGTYTPPEDIAQLSDIDAAKELFNALRTQAMSVTNYDNSGFLDTEALSMEEALNGVVLNISYITNMLQLFDEFALDLYINNQTEATGNISPTRSLTLTVDSPTSWNYEITEVNTTNIWSGTISYPEINASNAYTFTTLLAEVDGTFPLGYEFDLVPDGVENSQSFNGSMTASKTSSGANFTLNGEVASNGTSLAITNATAELAYDKNTTTDEPILNYFKFNGATLQGIVGEYTIDGSITVNSYVQNISLAPKGGIEETFTTYFNGGVTCSDGSNYSNGTVQITLDGITHELTTTFNGNFWSEIEGAYDINDFEYADSLGDIIVDNSICQAGTASAYINYADSWSDGQIANSGWLPNDITFEGAISRTGASIEGTLNAIWKNAETMDLESDTEMPFVDVTLNGKLQMPESPEMLMTLSYENNATHNMLGASYTYETTVINAEGVFDADMINGDVAITTHTGLRADIDVSNGDIVYGDTSNVTKDGLLIGEFEDREGLPVVKYTDGSFESIF